MDIQRKQRSDKEDGGQTDCSAILVIRKLLTRESVEDCLTLLICDGP